MEVLSRNNDKYQNLHYTHYIHFLLKKYLLNIYYFFVKEIYLFIKKISKTLKFFKKEIE